MDREEAKIILKEKRAQFRELAREIADLELYLNKGEEAPVKGKGADLIARNEAVYRDFEEGMKRKELMDKYKLGYERINSIINAGKWKGYREDKTSHSL